MNNKYDFDIFSYDFEVYEKINWFCVTFINFFTDERIQIVNDKTEFIKFYENHKNDVFISYNGRQYDTAIWKALLTDMNIGFVNHKIIFEGKKPFQVIKNFKKYQLYDYDAIIKDKSLKVLEAFMGDDIRETEVPFDIDRELTKKEIEQILFYNEHDSKELKKVVNVTWSDFEGQLDIIDLYGLDMSHISKTKVQLAAKVLNAVDQHTADDEFDIRLPDTIQISDKYKHICDWYLNEANWRYKDFLKTEDPQHSNQYETIVCGIPHVFGWGGCHGADDKESIFEGIILHADVALTQWGN